MLARGVIFLMAAVASGCVVANNGGAVPDAVAAGAPARASVDAPAVADAPAIAAVPVVVDAAVESVPSKPTVTCPAGQHPCGQACRSDDDVNACGAACQVCGAIANAHPLCLKNACLDTCNDHFHRCAGACVDGRSLATCGFNCSPCPPAPGGVATCQDDGLCGVDCQAPSFKCLSLVPLCKDPHLDFESGTLEGFALDGTSSGATSSLFISSARSASGGHSLALQVTGSAFLNLVLSPCDGDGAEVLNRRFVARIFVEGASGATPASLYAFSRRSGAVNGPSIEVSSATWQTISLDLTGPAASEVNEITLHLAGTFPGPGTVFVDDVRFQ